MIGIAFNKTKELNFPPSKNSCPDYWIADNTDPNKTVCKISDLNMGTIKKDTDGSYLMSETSTDKNKAYTPGYVAGSRVVDFSDPLWPAAFSGSGQCALKTWANKYEISWDGVSNFNNC
jgi:hypothetical protein